VLGARVLLRRRRREEAICDLLVMAMAAGQLLLVAGGAPAACRLHPAPCGSIISFPSHGLLGPRASGLGLLSAICYYLLSASYLPAARTCWWLAS
jgi:hypothetical protein